MTYFRIFRYLQTGGSSLFTHHYSPFMIKSLAHSMLHSLCTLLNIIKQSTILQTATIH